MNNPLSKTVAIIGRPNVGKSTLFNRLGGKRIAIETPFAGTTRDRLYADISFGGVSFSLIDMAGIESKSETPLNKEMQAGIETAKEEADLILFVVDWQEKDNQEDKNIARSLRNSKTPVLMIVNKVDNLEREEDIKEFERLGNFEIITVSSISGKNSGALLERIAKLLGKSKKSSDSNFDINLAILGRPNVGKSTLLNSLAGKERVIVSDIPGTTRDTAGIILNHKGKSVRLVDTAGIRRPGKIKKDTIESFSVLRSWRAFHESDIVLVLSDGSEGFVASDTHLIGEAKESGKGVILVINKIDKWQNPEENIAKMLSNLSVRLNFAPWLPVVFISASEKQNLAPLLNQIIKVNENLNYEIPQNDLDLILEDAKNTNSQLKDLIKLKQKRTKPVAFELLFQGKKPPHPSQIRSLENKIRDAYPLSGVPFFVDLKKI